LVVRQERQELENRLSLIESKQRQLEAQDRLISETLTFPPSSVAEPVIVGEAVHHVLDMSSGSGEYLVMSEPHSSTHLTKAVTGVTSSEPVSLLPGSSYNRMDTAETVHPAVPLQNKSGVVSGLPFVPQSGKISAHSEVDSHADRIREYQDELLRRHTDRPRALLEARKRLQMRAEQLLSSGLNLGSESQSNTSRAVGHSQFLTVPSNQLDLDGMEHYSASHLSRNDVSQISSGDVLQTQVVVAKPYKPELYQPKSLSEDAECFEYNAVVAGPSVGDDTDDERQFVTPELREDGRVRPCRVAEYSPSPSPHGNDAAYQIQQQQPVPSSHSNVQANKDDFGSLILQAQRDLEVRQRQMQDQLEALENEERRLVQQQLLISSQLGSFPSETQTLAGTSYSQEQTTVWDPCLSSSSDLLRPTVVVTPSVSAQTTPSFSCDTTLHHLPASTKMSELKLDQKDRISLDNSSWQTESHHLRLSHSSPVLQQQDNSSFCGISDQLPHARQSPVSTSINFWPSF